MVQANDRLVAVLKLPSKMWAMRHRARWVLLLAAAVAMAMAFVLIRGFYLRDDQKNTKLILYFENEGEVPRKLYSEFLSKVENLGLNRKYRLATEFVAVSDLDSAALRSLMRDQLGRLPAAIIATSAESAEIARDLTTKIPIIFASNSDPVQLGLIHDILRPGKNLTGFTSVLPTFGKRIEILKEAVPSIRRVGVLLEGSWILGSAELGDAVKFAALHGLSLHWFTADSESELVAAIAGPQGQLMDAWYVAYTDATFSYPKTILNALEKAGRPAIFERAKFADWGGLLAYEHTIEDPMGRLAEILSSILDGVPPGDIPVERPKRFELVLNIATAKKLSISVPKPVIKRADRIITQ